MKILLVTPLLAIAQETLSDWELNDLSLNCGFQEPTELSFVIYPGDVDIDTDAFAAHECSYGDLQISEEAITENLPAHQMEKGKKRVTIQYNAQTCMGTVGDPTDLATYASNITFNMDLGYTFQNVFMHFRTYRIPAICHFQSSYNLKFDFGKITDDVVEQNFTDIAPVNGGIDFELDVFKDSAHTQQLYNTNAGLKTSQMVYFTISPKFNMPTGLQFAPPKCRFLQETCDSLNNCDVHHEFELFNHEVNECKHPSNDLLRFDINYHQELNQWSSQYRVFLFGPDVGESTYTLRCEVDVCVAACDNESTVGDQKCRHIAQTCLESANYLEFNHQCKQCGAGRQANNTDDVCEKCPVNTFNDAVNSIEKCRACPDGSFSAEEASTCTTCENETLWDATTATCVQSVAERNGNRTRVQKIQHPSFYNLSPSKLFYHPS